MVGFGVGHSQQHCLQVGGEFVSAGAFVSEEGEVVRACVVPVCGWVGEVGAYRGVLFGLRAWGGLGCLRRRCG